MALINLRSAALHHRELPHQIESWRWLQEQLTEEQLVTFAALYRAAPDDYTPPPDLQAYSGSTAVELALPMIRYFEGFSAIAYVDPLSGGEPITIGYGTTRYPCGRQVRMGDTVTREEAETFLRWYADRCEEVQASRIPTWNQMSPQQQAAILGLAFNVGAHFFNSHGFATITRNLRDADWDAVPTTLLLYVNPKSSVEAGLRRRREAEGQLWRTGAWA